MKRRPAIDLGDEAKFITGIESDKNADEQASDLLRTNRKVWNRLAQNDPVNLNAETDTSEKKSEYKPHMPLVSMTIDQIQPRLVNAFRQGKPFVRFNPTDQNDVEGVRHCQDFMNFIVMNHIPNFNRSFDENSLITLTEGQSFVFQTWVKDERKVCHTYEFDQVQLEMDAFTGMPTESPTTVDRIVYDLFDAGASGDIPKRLIDWREQGEDHYVIDYEEKGNQTSGIPWVKHKADLYVWLDDHAGVIIAKVVKNEAVYEGVKMINQNLDHLFFPVDIASLQPGDCPHVLIRTSKSVSEVIRRYKSGDYDLLTKEKIEKIKKTLLDEKPIKASGAAEGIKDVEQTERQTFPEDIVEVWECYITKDVDDDGICEELVVTILPESRCIARVRYLEEIFMHGRRPIDVVYYDIRPYSIFGKGIPEKGRSLQQIYDDIWRQMLNYNEVITLPFFFYLAGGQMEGQVYKLRPGEGYPLSSLDDIRWPQFPNNLGTSFAELQMLWSTWERYMKINDPMMGIQGQARQTATATLKLLSESLEANSINFTRYKQGWSQIFLNTWQLYRAYMPEYMKFRIWDPMAKEGAGDWKFDKMAKKDMISYPDIDLSIDIEQTSKIFQRQLYTSLYEILMNQTNLLTKVTNANSAYNCLDRLLDAFDIKDKANFIVRPPEPTPPIEPQQEIYMLAQGIYPKPNPNEDINNHLAVHQTFVMSPEFKMLSPGIQQMHFQHIAETMQIAQQQQQMLSMSRDIAQATAGGENMLDGGGGGFMARPDTGQSPMAAYGRGISQGKANQPMLNTGMMG